MKSLYKIVLTLLLFTFIGCQNHYEKGLILIKEKKFKEAELEFQKVKLDDDNYQKSGDCINYLWGCDAYKGRRYSAAINYFLNMHSLYNSSLDYLNNNKGKEYLKYEKPEEIELLICNDAFEKLEDVKSDQRNSTLRSSERKLDDIQKGLKDFMDHMKD